MVLSFSFVLRTKHTLLCLSLIAVVFLLATASEIQAQGFTKETVINHPTTSAQLADFNRDGKMDIVVVEGGKHASGKQIFAWLEAPSWARHDIAKAGEMPGAFTGTLETLDVNKDGCVDVIVSEDQHSASSGRLYWYRNPCGSATGSWSRQKIAEFPSPSNHINDIAIVDMDRDGRDDIVIRHLGNQKVRIVFHDGGNNWTVASFDVRLREGLCIGDLDRDGRPDIVLNGFAWFADGNWRDKKYTEKTIHSSYYSQTNTGLNNSPKCTIADFDKDGRVDVLFSPAEGDPTTALAWYKAPANPRTQTWTRTVIQNNITGGHQALAVDIDLDGDLDVVSAVEPNLGGRYGFQQSVFVWENLGGATSWKKNIITTSAGMYFGLAQDLDKDGDIDILGPSQYAKTGSVFLYRNKLRTGSTPQAPTAPTNLSVTATTSSSIALRWSDTSNNETGFKIERAQGSGSYTQIATVSSNSTTFTSSGLSAGASYSFRIRAYNGTGNSGYSNAVTGVTSSAVTTPSAPSNLSASADSTTSVVLKWNDTSDNESGFKIERKVGSGSYSQITTVNANVTTYLSTGLARNTTYTFRVRAHNGAGNSQYTNQASAQTPQLVSIPSAPSNLSANAVAHDAIQLTWRDTSDNESGFKIEQKTGSGSFSQIATVGANTTSYRRTGLSAGTTYTFRVRSHNSAGNSSYSNGADATTTKVDGGDGSSTLRGVLRYFKFDEASGRTVLDHSEYQKHATLVNAVRTSGVRGGALRFTGSNSYVNAGTFDASGNTLTLAAWIKPERFLNPPEGRIISKATGIQEYQHYFMLSTAASGGAIRLRARFKVNGKTHTLIASKGAVPKDTWSHAAATYDGKTIRLYLNSELVGSKVVAGRLDKNSSVPVWIGANPKRANERPFVGLIDEAIILDRALPADEIVQLLHARVMAREIEISERHDKASFSLQSPFYFVWNGFERQNNVTVLHNVCDEDTVSAQVTLLDASGNRRSTDAVQLAPHQEYDLLVNQLAGFEENQYGLVKVEYSPAGCLDGYSGLYRFGEANDVEFALIKEFGNPIQGKAGYAVFNTMQPSLHPLEANDVVYQWLQIANLDGEERSFTVTRYGMNGSVVNRQTVSVAAEGRLDIAAGHEDAERTVGLVEVVPTDPTAKYSGELFRYGTSSSGVTNYRFALADNLLEGQSDEQFVSISSGAGAENWVEFINLADEAQEVEIAVHTNSGAAAHRGRVVLAPKAQWHFNASHWVPDGQSGIVRATSLANQPLLAKSTVYFYAADGSIAAAYTGAGVRTLGQLGHTLYNTFLGQSNWLRVSNVLERETSVLIQAFDAEGLLIADHTLHLPANSGRDLELNATLGFGIAPDSYGQLRIIPTDALGIAASIVRVAPGVGAEASMIKTLPVR
ncbi:MAG: fibronectin type III domain-containing protein [Bdellovibrionales bacterium]|nr:fibronectin type III domain-containing protein [Bdellovibrionales bacterium]